MKQQTEMDLGVRFKPPTLIEVIDRGFIMYPQLPLHECEKFHSYYSSNGWMVGRTKMKSWRDALTHWSLLWKERSKPQESKKTAFHYKTVLEAKNRIADEIRNKHCLTVAGGHRWTNLDKKKEWIELRKQIREINEQISNL